MDEKPNFDLPWCYYIPRDQDVTKHGGYVPSIVVEGETGHWPMTGGKSREPWVWGKTIEQADLVCRAQNESMGISEKRADQIVSSSMMADERMRVCAN